MRKLIVVPPLNCAADDDVVNGELTSSSVSIIPSGSRSSLNSPDYLLSVFQPHLQLWTRLAVFDFEHVYMSSFDLDKKFISAFRSIFDDRSKTLSTGITIDSEGTFLVTGFYSDKRLVYGRRGPSGLGDGVAICAGTRSHNNAPIWVLVTYELPVVSARAIPPLYELVNGPLTKF